MKLNYANRGPRVFVCSCAIVLLCMLVFILPGYRVRSTASAEMQRQAGCAIKEFIEVRKCKAGEECRGFEWRLRVTVNSVSGDHTGTMLVTTGKPASIEWDNKTAEFAQ